MLTIFLSAVRVVALGASVAGTIGFTTGLDPDEGISLRVTSLTGWADTETGAVDVAPVTPLLAETGNGVTASINDGIVGHASSLELLAEGSDVLLLVLALVPLSISGLGEFTGRKVPGVPASDVGGETTELLGATTGLVGLGELLSTRLCKEILVTNKRKRTLTVTYSGCRSSRASHRGQHRCT